MLLVLKITAAALLYTSWKTWFAFTWQMETQLDMMNFSQVHFETILIAKRPFTLGAKGVWTVDVDYCIRIGNGIVVQHHVMNKSAVCSILSPCFKWYFAYTTVVVRVVWIREVFAGFTHLQWRECHLMYQAKMRSIVVFGTVSFTARTAVIIGIIDNWVYVAFLWCWWKHRVYHL